MAIVTTGLRILKSNSQKKTEKTSRFPFLRLFLRFHLFVVTLSKDRNFFRNSAGLTQNFTDVKIFRGPVSCISKLADS
jgi:hypothetical protein